MLKISAEQFESIADHRFRQRLTEIILQNAPDGKGAIDTPPGQQVLAEQIQKARGYGMHAELEIANYVMTAWLLGPDFDHRFPAMAQVLLAPELPSLKKAEAIEKICTVLLFQLQSQVG